jgi:hypothetical protein
MIDKIIKQAWRHCQGADSIVDSLMLRSEC